MPPIDSLNTTPPTVDTVQVPDQLDQLVWRTRDAHAAATTAAERAQLMRELSREADAAADRAHLAMRQARADLLEFVEGGAK